eukprot:CAMPEP_0201961754 /NCGR_PEP_ID=MMETSP0904-20121228/8127_1 /ASSEMBLY_ACC=CAM_ASM_000553 /TAXON_ID=420261 /ORGANISM="Thalassiosira antarctica, Strain CCMP982" /LENGTH=48 /DNA_ID= /DNA_START= /DNA_END= /DNA_ORIENTATION=
MASIVPAYAPLGVERQTWKPPSTMQLDMMVFVWMWRGFVMARLEDGQF